MRTLRGLPRRPRGPDHWVVLWVPSSALLLPGVPARRVVRLFSVFGTSQIRPLTLSTTNNRPAHKKECKQAQRALVAAVSAAGGETEAAKVEPDSMNPAVVETCETATVVSSHAPCDHCAVATPEAELLVCTGCCQARYCSLACQHDAWFGRFVGCVQLSFSS